MADMSEEKFREILGPLLLKEKPLIEFKANQRRKNGTFYLAEFHIQIALFHDKLTFFAFVIDVTESDILEKQLFHSAKLSSIGEVAASVGHEINNPLAIAAGNLLRLKRYLEKQNSLTEEAGILIRKQEDANTRIRKIVDNLRIYSRTDSSEFETFDLKENIKQTIQLMKDIANFKDVEFEEDYPPEPVFINGNSGYFQQVIMNVFSNARDATEEGKRSVIVVSLKSNGKKASIAVKDNGCGMKPEVIEKIFQPFYTTKPLGKGTGLGMGIIKKLTESMNGCVGIHSEFQVGTTVTLSFPLASNQNGKSEKNGENAA